MDERSRSAHVMAIISISYVLCIVGGVVVGGIVFNKLLDYSPPLATIAVLVLGLGAAYWFLYRSYKESPD